MPDSPEQDDRRFFGLRRCKNGALDGFNNQLTQILLETYFEPQHGLLVCWSMIWNQDRPTLAMSRSFHSLGQSQTCFIRQTQLYAPGPMVVAAKFAA